MATKAEQIYDEVNECVDSGMKKADAFKQLAEKYGQPFDSMRGAYYGHKRKVQGGSSRTRRRETTAADAVESAKVTLQRAIEAIDREINAAKDRSDEAKAEYEALAASAAERKTEIEAKIAMLES
jgi:predicted  nucleic acid-binding Zn-ribbon protein